ncbi:MAG: prolipoprotein diacylglyceryl transferase [Proteobacteria bacterium]|nr:prolipoprotein diacylglyceryl transferase [Pseudomonadota bacterium]MBU1232849.1 prolipoprotein diacylglyceryl transferase [Pseudomonadota bacterium]MBU1418381.1 prolipoprotein diacylglyceryl transferase [Pseudomonadota bacterium]MBU1455361.1 prolipoprotein diacylglyceryl transferase [Pseudomonadota bacterium]
MIFPSIDPVILSLGPLQVRWYGLMYVLGFTASYLLVQKQIRSFSYKELEAHFENLNLILILSVVLGGRLGYVVFYNFSYYLQHPLEIPATWTGGMSFHGACIGVLLGGWLYVRKKRLDFWRVADLYVVTIPIGLGLGRLGNFINGELYGRTSSLPWAMVFPEGGPQPRHPSQLYEMLLEGLLLFLILWSQKNKPWTDKKGWPHGSMLCLFLIGYGCFRMIVELFREPDQQLGFVLGFLTMGQLLSGFMILAGSLLWRIRIKTGS